MCADPDGLDSIVTDAMVARMNAVADLGEDADPKLVAQLMVEAIRMLSADEAWNAAKRSRATLTENDALLAQMTEIAAEKGSPEAAFAMYADAADLTTQLRWLLRADRLDHAEARAIADGLRAEGLVPPRA